MERIPTRLRGAIQQHGANVADRLGRVEPLGTDVDAILDAMASEHAEGVIQLCQTLFCRSIATVSQEAVCL